MRGKVGKEWFTVVGMHTESESETYTASIE